MIRTRSPTLHSLPSSWALKRTRCRMTFLYSGCALRSVTCTTTVLSILSETTVPSRTLRRFRCSVVVVVCCSVSVISLVSGRSAAGSWPRSGGLFGSLHVLGCLLVRRPDGSLRDGLSAGDLGGHGSRDQLVVLDRDLEDL